MDVKKQWYVYYSYAHPTEVTSKGQPKMVRQPKIYIDGHKIKNAYKRRAYYNRIAKILHQLLKDGYSPYATEKPKKKTTLIDAIADALELKSHTLKKSSYDALKGKVNRFVEYCKKNHIMYSDITEITREHLVDYLNYILKKSSPRTRNNTRADLSSVFTTLVDIGYIKQNLFLTIKPLKSKSVQNKSYNKQQVAEIFNYLKKKDPLLLLFIKFISYNFLRPIEVCRIKMNMIDFDNKRVTFNAKNKERKIKIIPNIVFNEIKHLKENSDKFLFTPNGLVGEWDTEETNKRNYFSKRFRKTIKEPFNLGKDYTMYSFRHTFITDLYRNFRQTMTPFEAKSNLMLITGHSTMDALNRYLRDIDAELPTDYSDNFSM